MGNLQKPSLEGNGLISRKNVEAMVSVIIATMKPLKCTDYSRTHTYQINVSILVMHIFILALSEDV